MRKKLIEQRKQQGFTQKSLAKKIGISRSTIAAYERGLITPSLGVCLKIKEALSYLDDDLFCDTNKWYWGVYIMKYTLKTGAESSALDLKVYMETYMAISGSNTSNYEHYKYYPG